MIVYTILLKQERTKSLSTQEQTTHVQEGEHEREKLELTIAMSPRPLLGVIAKFTTPPRTPITWEPETPVDLTLNYSNTKKLLLTFLTLF